MDLPDLKLHELRGDRSGIWSVTVGGNYRITFQIDVEDIYNVDYEDYALKGDFIRIHNPSHPGEIIWEFCVEVLEFSYKCSEVVGSEQEILFSSIKREVWY